MSLKVVHTRPSFELSTEFTKKSVPLKHLSVCHNNYSSIISEISSKLVHNLKKYFAKKNLKVQKEKKKLLQQYIPCLDSKFVKIVYI